MQAWVRGVLLLWLLQLGLQLQDVLLLLGQQAAELLVAPPEVGLAGREGLVAAAQLGVQLSAQTDPTGSAEKQQVSQETRDSDVRYEEVKLRKFLVR